MNFTKEELTAHIPYLKGFAIKLNGFQGHDDLVQDVLEMALRKNRLYIRGTNLKRWLFSIMYYRHVSKLRTNKADQKANKTFYLQSLRQRELTEPNAEFTVDLNTLHQALSVLPTPQQEVIYETVFKEQTFKETAANLNIPLGTVKSRSHMARKKLEKMLVI